MPVYRAKIAGRTLPVLIRSDTAAKGKDQLVSLEALTGEEMADALDAGEKVWKVGDPFPADKPAIEEGEEQGGGDPPKVDEVAIDPPAQVGKPGAKAKAGASEQVEA